MRRLWNNVTISVALLLAGFLALSAQTTAPTRGVLAVGPQAARLPQPGPYYALIIGNSHYPHLGRDGNLVTPTADAQELAALLGTRFGFQTQLLLDADRNQILTALVKYRKELPENSNLLIYYAGHGFHDRDVDEAYWWPVDASQDSNASWISADDITRDIKAIPSRHVLVISDSCYSGYLAATSRTAEARLDPKSRNGLLAKMLGSRSRMLMSSGRDEPVSDGGAEGHSIFAAALLEALRSINQQAFSGAELFDLYVQPKVGGPSNQLPQYSWIQNSGHQFGDFVFTTASTADTATDRNTAPESDTAADLPSAAHVVGWVASYNGYILKSETGSRWKPSMMHRSGGFMFHAASFPTSQSGWVGTKDALLYTADGGNSWHQTLDNKEYGSVYFVDPQTGWVIADGSLLHTIDAGKTWRRQECGQKLSSSNGLYFITQRDGWIYGTATILHTNDGGNTWVRQSLGNFDAYAAGTFLDARSGWIVGSGSFFGETTGVVLHTIDGGAHWSRQSIPNVMLILAVFFLNSQVGWISAQNGTIFHTSDGGAHWTLHSSGMKNVIHSLAFVDPLHGWAAGPGVILHTDDGGVTWSTQYQDEYDDFNSIAVFPAP